MTLAGKPGPDTKAPEALIGATLGGPGATEGGSTLERRSRLGGWNASLLVGGTVVIVLVALVPLAPVLAPADPLLTDVPNRNLPPGEGGLLGTDHFGRDMLSRLMYGTQSSLIVALSSTLIALVIGSTVGIISAYARGWFDTGIGRVMDVFLSIPLLVLAMAIAATIGNGLFETSLALVIILIPIFFRMVRGPVLSELQREYVLAARVIGGSPFRVAIDHIVPNILYVVVVQATITISGVILVEASLSFLGLGIPPPAPSWGRMLEEARPTMVIAPWQAIWPGIWIAVAVLAFNLLGDGLRDHWDPRRQRR